MIKTIILLTPVLFLASCTIPEDAADSEITTSKTELLINVLSDEEPKQNQRKAENDLLLFKAAGFEPGWSIDIYNNKAMIVLDYGVDTLNLSDDFSGLKKGESFNFKGKLNKKAISISISNSICSDEATGEKKDAQVILMLDDKKYTCCGMFQ